MRPDFRIILMPGALCLVRSGDDLFKKAPQRSGSRHSLRICRSEKVRIEKLGVNNLNILTELFDYNDVEDMISECTQNIQNGIIDIFVLYDNSELIGELHVMYESDDENYAALGRRAYLFAFRIREDHQNKGYGTHFLKAVMSLLKENGYYEFTVGVEDENFRAKHIYQSLGFNEILLRKQEEYQGDTYEYDLYLKR
ncbi:MAG: GNAT family N-acetyltransferase [Oscillospiraceae bacterium]